MGSSTATTTSSAITTRFIHTDNLSGSSIVTNASGTVVETLDYYPYGGQRIDTKVGNFIGEKNKYAGTQYDTVSTLNYMNARYYEATRGQFLFQDPVFWGNPKQQDLMNPQNLNSYSYSVDNPINKSDPTGLWYKEFITGQQSWPSFYGELGDAANQLGQQSPGWNFAFNHPIATGGIVGVASLPALYAGEGLSGAYTMATWQGVSTAFAAKNAFAAVVYASLVGGSTLDIPGVVNSFSSANLSNPSSFYSGALSLGMQIGPNFAGQYAGSISDAFQFSKMVVNGLGSAASNLFSSSVQTRQSTTQTFNSGLGGGGGGAPNSNSLWVTPNGAVVTFGGNLVAPAPSKK